MEGREQRKERDHYTRLLKIKTSLASQTHSRQKGKEGYSNSLYTQFTGPFPFLQKWVWLARLDWEEERDGKQQEISCGEDEYHLYKQWSCVKVCSNVLDPSASWFYNRFVRLFLLFVFACVFVDDYIVVLNELYHCSFVPRFKLPAGPNIPTFFWN